MRVTRNTRTPGLPGARNTGIALARYPLIGLLRRRRLLAPGQGAGPDGRHGAPPAPDASVTGIRIHYGDKVRHRSCASPILRHADLVRDRVTAAHPSSYLVEKAVADVAGPVDETIPGGYGEDYDWLLRVARHTDIACVTEPMVEVLWHPGSFFTRRWDTITEALAYVLDKHPEIAVTPAARPGSTVSRPSPSRHSGSGARPGRTGGPRCGRTPANAAPWRRWSSSPVCSAPTGSFTSPTGSGEASDGHPSLAGLPTVRAGLRLSGSRSAA